MGLASAPENTRMKDLIKSLILAIGRLFPERLSPGHAIVLSCDEKGQIQALDRTQPGLPL